MYRIALVQNTSEMRSYPFADLRAPLAEMGFDFVHFTSENIGSLDAELVHGIDCVVFSSNSLHDDAIKTHVYAESFCRAFEKYLETGAVLVMHQYKLAVKADDTQTPPALPFLGKNIRLIKDSRTEKERNSRERCFKFTQNGDAYRSFPNRVCADDVFKQAIDSPGVHLDYSMILEGEENEWIPLMTDAEGRGVIKRAADKKIVFSSILLDYQRHLTLLENVLVNLLAGNMSLAVYKEHTENSLGFSYFLNHLENKKLYFKHYTSDDREHMIGNIKNGVHSGVLVGSGMMKKLTDEDLRVIDEAGVKLIKLRDRKNDGDDFFEVHSVDKTSCLNFAKAEREVQEELAKSPKQSSFMVRVDLLSALSEFKAKGLCRGEYTAETLSVVLSNAKQHVDASKNGSYDDTFGATLRVLWLFYTFLGKNDEYTKKVYDYVSECDVSCNAIREKLDKYITLSLFEKDRAEYLRESCASIINVIDVSTINEYDMLILLELADLTDDNALLELVVEYVEEHVSDHDVTLGIYAAAVTASRFTDVYQRLCARTDAVSCDICNRIEQLLFSLVKYLNSDNCICSRADQRLRRACALYKFESVTSFPVADLSELLFKTGTFPKEKCEQESYIDSCQAVRLKNDRLILENESLAKSSSAMEEELGHLRKDVRGKRVLEAALYFALLLGAVAVYLTVDLTIKLSDMGEPIVDNMIKKVIDWWPALFGALIIPFAKYIYKRFLKKKEK
ncbi:MAG: hypothetical protein IJF74_04925 [Clostridia bacterium]|nr:hypothetical protein [Clostridia bacterium]